MKKVTAKLALGPMSTEAIEAVFRYSQVNSVQLMLIASKNQIDYIQGYVNNWSTEEYMEHIKKMRLLYPYADVIIARDHCGPGFNGSDSLGDAIMTATHDCVAGFDLIHIDLCHWKAEHSEKLKMTARIIKTIKQHFPNMLFEIGTDENTGTSWVDLERIESDVKYFVEQGIIPEFYVVQTGSLVMEGKQSGRFNLKQVREASNILHAYGTKLKEHNADYLDMLELAKRKGLVDAVNIAPQLGTMQSWYVINALELKELNYLGLPSAYNWMQKVFSEGKWQKWTKRETMNLHDATILAGHYHFTDSNYKSLFQPSLSTHAVLDSENIIIYLTEIIDLYVKSLT